MDNEQIELKGVFGGSLFHNVKSGWVLFACFFSVFFPTLQVLCIYNMVTSLGFLLDS